MGEALRAMCGGPIGLRVAGAFDGYLLEIDSIDTAGFSVPIYSLFIYYLHVCMYIYILYALFLGFCFTEASCGSRSKLVQQSRYNEYEVMTRSVGIA